MFGAPQSDSELGDRVLDDLRDRKIVGRALLTTSD
jgi:hypothetical protein